MSWYRDDDEKIITDEEFQDDCCNCSAFCSEGTITVPCNGERSDCPYFKEVDTSEYDKGIREKTIDEFVKRIHKEFSDYRIDGKIIDYWIDRLIDNISEEMKAGAE